MHCSLAPLSTCVFNWQLLLIPLNLSQVWKFRQVCAIPSAIHLPATRGNAETTNLKLFPHTEMKTETL